MTSQINNTQVKFPVFKMLLGDLDLLLRADRYAWLLCFLFAGLETLIFAISGNLFICSSGGYRETHFCNNSFWAFMFIQLLVIFIICMFARNWTAIALNKEKFNLKSIFVPSLRDFKLLGLLGLYILTLAIAILCFYLLYIRVPNPNWKIEITYFAIISIGFIIPLLALKFSSYVAAAALGEKLVSPKIIWQKTSGNFMLILGGITLIGFLYLIIMLQASRFILLAGEVSSFLQALITEYIINLLKIIIVALLMNFCYIQHKLMFGSDKNE